MKKNKDDFRSKTIKGLTWSTFSQVGEKISMLLITIILMRILSPEEYGLVTIILIIVNFADVIVNFGFGPAIIQKDDITQTDLASIFWLNIVFGIISTILIALCAPFIAQFYGIPILETITYLLAPIFFIASLNVVQRMLLAKDINFKALATIELISPMFAGVTAITLAWFGWGVWSLVAQQLVLFSTMAIILWGINPWRPTWEFSMHSIKSMTKFSLNMFGNQSLNYWTKQLDQLIIGKFFISNSLGIYNRAVAFVLTPIRGVSNVINRVMFPSFSSIQYQKERIATVYIQIIDILAFIVFPVMIGLFVVSEIFVGVVFGQQWVEMIPYLKIFCLVGIVQSINTLPNSLLYAMGQTDTAFKIGLFQKINTVLFIIIGFQWGMKGIAVGILISEIINIWPKLYYSGKLVNLSVFQQLKPMINIAICTLLMGFFVHSLQIYLNGLIINKAILLVCIVAGLISYLLLAFIVKLNALEQIKTVVAKVLKKQ